MQLNARRVLRYVASIPAHLAFAVLRIPVIERRRFNAYLTAKKSHQPELPKLSSLEEKIVAELKLEGVAVTSLSALALEGTAEMISAGERLSAEWLHRRNPIASVPVTKATREAAHTAAYLDIAKWGLDPSLLRIAESYFGLPPAYDGPKVVHTPADGKQAGTRLWHRDREDRRMMKVAIYPNPVTEDGGPLQLIKRQVFDGPLDRDFKYPLLTHAQLSQKLEQPIDDDPDITSCTGPAGTVIFIDTARLFHRGKPSVFSDRCATFHSYFSRRPRNPFFCERSGLSRAKLAKLSEKMSPLEREAVLWRNNLSGLMKRIPTSQI